jgi:transcriptional enhancer factor
MFVQRKVDLETSERLHTYTRTTTRRQHDQYIPDVETFGSEYPLLRSMGSLQPLDCNILAAEASIAFPIENCWTDRKNVELGISFLCTSKYLPPGVEISCRNSFYRNGLRDEGYSNTSYEHVCITTPSEDGSSLETQLKFGSAFWACNLGGTKNLIDRREEVAIFLKGVTAVQEIMFGSPNTGGERLLIIHWKFQLERAEPVGKAQWRRLRLDPTGVNLSPTKSENEEMKSERVDSNYEYAVRPMHIDPYQPAPPNALQSPFEYDNSSSSTGSALHSATWPTSASFDMGDGTSTAPPSAIEQFPPHGEDAFDFSGGTINISYDMDLSSFDTTTFDFEAGADFTTDPALQNYTASTQDGFGQQSYDTSWYDSFEGSQQPCPAPSEHHHNPSISAGATDELPPTDDFGFDIPSTCGAENQPLVAAYDAYPGSCYEDHYHSATYDVGPHETQAYEGAGQDVAVKDEGSLLALPEAGGVYLGPDRASSQVEEGNQESG